MQSSMWSSQQIESAHTRCVLQRTTCALVPYNAAESGSKAPVSSMRTVRRPSKRCARLSNGPEPPALATASVAASPAWAALHKICERMRRRQRMPATCAMCGTEAVLSTRRSVKSVQPHRLHLHMHTEHSTDRSSWHAGFSRCCVMHCGDEQQALRENVSSRHLVDADDSKHASRRLLCGALHMSTAAPASAASSPVCDIFWASCAMHCSPTPAFRLPLCMAAGYP